MTVIAGALVVLAYILVCYLIGRLILAALGIHTDGLTRAGSAPIGAAAMAVQLWIYGVIHVPWWSVLLLGPWLVAGIVIRRQLLDALRADLDVLRELPGELLSLDPLAWGLAGVTVVTAGYYLVSLVAQPVIGWDAIAMWLFKAKVFFEYSSLDLSRIHDTMQWDRHFDYPPLVPLVYDSLWVLLGRVDDNLAKAVLFLFLIAVVWAAIALLLPLIGSRLTVMVALILVAMPTLQTSFVYPFYMGYADYAVAAFMTLSLAHLYRAAALGRDQDSALAVVYAALGALTKNEGVPFLIMVLAVVGAVAGWRLLRSRERPAAQLIAIAAASLVPFLAWELYVRAHGFNNAFLAHEHPSLASLPSRTRTMLVFFRHLMNRMDDYPWFVAAWLFATIALAARQSLRFVLVWAVVTGQALFYFLALLFTPGDVTYELITAADRLVLQWSPLVVLLLGIALYELLPTAELRRPASSRSEASAGSAAGRERAASI